MFVVNTTIMKKLIVIAIFNFLFNNTFAQWVTNTSINTIISDDATYSETVPISAPGLNGSTYISWFQGNANGSYDAMLQLLDINGYPLWSTPLVVSNNPQSSALYNSDFTSDNTGNAIMAFQDIRNGDLQTVIYKVDASGNFVWGSNGIALHDMNATFEAAPKIAVFNNDDVVVGWSASASSNKWIAWQIISASGISMFSSPQIIDSPTVNFSRVNPVVTSANSFNLVYVQETGSFPGLTSLIFCQQYNQNGIAQWPAAIQISSYGLGFVAIPYVVADNTGGCYIGFNSGTPGAPAINDAFIQRVNPAGVTMFGADGAELSALNGNHKFLKDMFLNPLDAKVYCVLKITDSGQNGAGVYAQAVDASGLMQFTANAMEIVPISTTSPCEAFTIDNAGNGCVITYTEGGFNSQVIKAHKLNYSGTLLFANPVILSDANSGKSRVTSNSMQGGNQLVISWEDTRINQGIYAQNMGNDGSIGVITAINDKKNIDNHEIIVSTIVNNQISLFGANTADFKLISSTGQFIYTQKLYKGLNILKALNVANGIYFYEVSNGHFSSKGKVILN
jgi:hypothetical protein